MSHSKIHWLWQILGEINELPPGRAKLVGLNPKYDWLTPVDAIPFVGAANKLNKGRKVLLASKGKLLWLGAAIYGDYLLVKQGLQYLNVRNSKGSGAPLLTSPTAPTKAISRSSSTRSSCPRGMRWDRKKGKCVRIRRR
jgi:hypothetical protein